jgi:GNAT superfamily N-acetyltransferase
LEIREATSSDIPAIFSIRTAVNENAASLARLLELGITPDSVAEAFGAQCKGWVAIEANQVVGFSIADAQAKSVWTLFILPEFESRGIGQALMKRTIDWLRETGAARIWLTTGPTTRAAGFYSYLGWNATGMTPHGEIRFELDLDSNPHTCG